MEFGRHLIEATDWNELKSKILAHDSKPHMNTPHFQTQRPASPTTFRRYAMHTIGPLHPIATSKQTRRFESNLDTYHYKQPLDRLKNCKIVDAPDAHFQCDAWSNRNILLWWLGRIGHLDTALIAALLIMLHPSWPPRALLLAKISNRNDKYLIELPGSDVNFEIDKPRAKSMKREKLTLFHTR